MTYYPLLNGAKGLLWYTFKGYGQNLPIDDPELWNAHKALLKEITELTPLFLEPGFGKDIKLVEDSKLIKAKIKTSKIGTFVIALNISKTETVKPELIISKKYNGNIVNYSTGEKILVKNGILNDELKPLDVHIYKLK
jgi:hypothetical protein